MNRDAKRIKPGYRSQVEAIKGHIRDARRPFSGIGAPFRVALRECRAEGLVIVYDRKTGDCTLKK